MQPDFPSADDRPALDDELVRAIAADTSFEPVAPAVSSRVRHRLLQRISEAESSHLTVQAAQDTWQPFQRGVMIKVLHEAAGVMSYLLRLSPGAVLPAHRHPLDEECMVLEGSVRIGTSLVVIAGGFHLARKDALHAEIVSDEGATLFLRGAPPHPAAMI